MRPYRIAASCGHVRVLALLAVIVVVALLLLPRLGLIVRGLEVKQPAASPELTSEEGNAQRALGAEAKRGAGSKIPVLAAKARRQQRYGRLPLGFEVNRGQADAHVKFLARGTGYSLFLTGDEAVLSLRHLNSRVRGQLASGRRVPVVRSRFKLPPENALQTTELLLPPLIEDPRFQIQDPLAPNTNDSAPWILRMKLMGAYAQAELTGMDELPGRTNYCIGNDPKQWRTDVPNYAKVKYSNVYPGVDLVYYGNEGKLEYDFVVKPGADLQQIGSQIVAPASGRAGASRMSQLHVDAQGDLVLATGDGEVRFHKPVVYQPAIENEQTANDLGQKTKGKRFVDGHYVLKGDQITFEVANYDRRCPIVIDPELVYSTYLGGSSYDAGIGIAVDASGNAYITGSTYSSNFPTTSDSYQTAFGGNTDTFVSKLNGSGSALVYSTYLGGSNSDQASGIAVDASGNAYVTGFTFSSDLPTTPGALQTTCNRTCAFVSKLSATGSALLYSTYLGGGDDDYGLGIALDASGNAYVAGETFSSDFPTTAGAFQTTFGGGTDAFVTRVNATGSDLVYSTYLGGTSFDIGYGIALDGSGNVYVTGSTQSPDFPTTSAGLQAAHPGNDDAFVSKLNAAGSALIYSTYLGGCSADGGFAIAVDASGEAFITGATDSRFDFPTSPGAFQMTCKGCDNSCYESTSSQGDAFVTKLNAAGSALVYSTYLGGSNDEPSWAPEEGTAIAVDIAGNAYITGLTHSSDFPTTPGAAFQTIYGGGAVDSFVSKVNATGSALVYSTYLGASTDDFGRAIAVDASGNAYVTGSTHSFNFPTTPDAFQTTFGGGFVSKFSFGGTGTGAIVQLTPTSLTFADQAVGTASDSQILRLSNIGDASLVINQFRDPNNADFQVYEGCGPYGSSLAAGASCKIAVKFTPIKEGTRYGAVEIYDNAPGSPQRVLLQGTGFGTSPIADLEPSLPIAFAPQRVSTTSVAKTLLFINEGNAPMNITAIASGGDFAETNNCPAMLAPGASCQVPITFTPTAAGTRTGWVAFTDNAPGSPQISYLSGTGVQSRDYSRREVRPFLRSNTKW